MKTYSLNGLLVKALLSINRNLDCLRAKLSVIALAIRDCLDGIGSMAYIFKKAKDFEKTKVQKECITNGYITYKDIANVTAGAMDLYNASAICIRNNKKIQKLVCADWYNSVDTAVSVKSHNITKGDVHYLKGLCEPGNVTDIIALAICSKKAEKTSRANITALYHKINTTQVLDTFDKCNLTSSQKERICNMKNHGYKSQQVIKEFTRYSQDYIITLYNNCTKPAKVTPRDGETMCLYKSFNITFTEHPMSSLWNLLIKAYGIKTIEAYLKKNCRKAGDMIEKKYHKTSVSYHKSYGRVATTNLEDSNR